MAIWTKEIADIDPEILDTPFRLQSANLDGSELDVFGIVTTECLPHSIPYPGREDRRLAGFSNICTHMGCHLVTFNSRLRRDDRTRNLICGPCPCHGTNFNLSRNGIVVIGPASQHLPLLELSLSEDEVMLNATFPGNTIDPLREDWPNTA